jgi:hypothetical protein
VALPESGLQLQVPGFLESGFPKSEFLESEFLDLQVPGFPGFLELL